jgi:hypothetical protein
LKHQDWNRRRPPGVWNTGTIYDILSNPTYCGQWRWGVTRSHDSVVDTSPEKEPTTVDVPAIVDRELWEAAQERRAYNKRMSARNVKKE